METTDILRRLSEASGVSGYEDEVRDLVRTEFAARADEVRIDTLGNVIALKRGTANPPRSIMLAGHMDEIGLMITDIEQGFLRFTQVGGFDPRVLLAQEVIVHGQRPLPGVIGSRPPHVLSPEARNKPISLEDLFIDVGLPEEELRQLVHVGDLVTLRKPFVELKGGLVSGKAFDDRASIAAIIHCLEELRSVNHAWNVFAVATVQEEIGLRGAITSAYGIAPDLAIAIDVTFARQPDFTDTSLEINKGPAIALGPNIHPILHKELVETAKNLEIPHQIEPIPGPSGTDAWAIQVTREGIPTALLSIPIRSMHTPVETLAIKDIERTGRLMAGFIARLDETFLDRLTLSPAEEGGDA